MPAAPIACQIWQRVYAGLVSTMNVSLPESLKSFVDEQVARCGYGNSSEYIRELIRRDQDRLRLRSLLLEGAASPQAPRATGAYFAGLRRRVRSRTSR